MDVKEFDPTAVREAAKCLVSNWHYNYGHPKTTFAKKSERLVDDVDCVAVAYLALTDPAPLTVEVLAGMGGKRVGEDRYWLPGGVFVTTDSGRPWRWWLPSSQADWPIDARIVPRIAGELTQLLMRMEK